MDISKVCSKPFWHGSKARTYLIVSAICMLLLTWSQLVGWSNRNYVKLIQEALKNRGQDSRYIETYRKTVKLPHNTKYLLLWNSEEYEPFLSLGTGQRAFMKQSCFFTNCYVTSNRTFFKDVSMFDAVAFNGRFLDDIPKTRSQHQKYIYFNMESADNYPVCDQQFDVFFNMTATYRLDSDIVFNYFSIRDLHGNLVGPKADMVWMKNMSKVNDDSELMTKLRNKTKAVAWFVSKCKTLNHREVYIAKLQNALEVYDLSVDIYGSCGRYKCPREKMAECETKLENDYYFYLALENSFAEDYVSEKVLTALKHYTVPVVYGGANYSRFLPPDSYLDARKKTPHQLAASIAQLVWSLPLYKRFFKWRNHYLYSGVQRQCALCEALNNDTVMKSRSVHRDFRAWWNPSYKEKCHNYGYFFG